MVGGVRGAFANHSLFLPTTQRCDGPPVRAGVTRTFPGMGAGSGGVRADLRPAARAKGWGCGFVARVRKGAKAAAGASQIKSSTESKFSKPRPRRPGSSALAAALLTTFPPRVPSKLRKPSHEHHVHLSCEARNIVWRKTFEESCCKTESERCCKMQRQRRRPRRACLANLYSLRNEAFVQVQETP